MLDLASKKSEPELQSLPPPPPTTLPLSPSSGHEAFDSVSGVGSGPERCLGSEVAGREVVFEVVFDVVFEVVFEAVGVVVEGGLG